MKFDDVYTEYYNLVCSIVRKFVPHNDVEDCTQEVFIRVLKYLHTIEDERKSFYWIYSIARNTSINYGKSLSIRALSKAGELNEELEIEHTFEDWYEEAKKCLMDADPLVRDVTLLKLEGYGQREVSGRLGIKRKQFYDLWAQGKELLIEGMGR